MGQSSSAMDQGETPTVIEMSNLDSVITEQPTRSSNEKITDPDEGDLFMCCCPPHTLIHQEKCDCTGCGEWISDCGDIMCTDCGDADCGDCDF